jgi:hypothetical protein
MTNVRAKAAAVLLTWMLASAASVSQANTVGFTFYTGSGATAPIAGNQYTVLVTDNGSTVSFKFQNQGAAGYVSSITDLYIDDNTPLFAVPPDLSDSGASVAFTLDATPPNLPGGPGINFFATSSADSNSGGLSANGVDWTVSGDEWVTLEFDLLPGKTFQNVTDAIKTGNLRMGIHVQAFVDQGSGTYVNGAWLDTVVTPVPLPAAAWAGLALFGVIGARSAVDRRRGMAV